MAIVLNGGHKRRFPCNQETMDSNVGQRVRNKDCVERPKQSSSWVGSEALVLLSREIQHLPGHVETVAFQ